MTEAHALRILEEILAAHQDRDRRWGGRDHPDLDQHAPMIGGEAPAVTTTRYAARHADRNDGPAWLHIAVEELAKVAHALMVAQVKTDPPTPVQVGGQLLVPKPELSEPRPRLQAPRDQLIAAAATLVGWIAAIDARGGLIRWPATPLPAFGATPPIQVGRFSVEPAPLDGQLYVSRLRAFGDDITGTLHRIDGPGVETLVVKHPPEPERFEDALIHADHVELVPEHVQAGQLGATVSATLPRFAWEKGEQGRRWLAHKAAQDVRPGPPPEAHSVTTGERHPWGWLVDELEARALGVDQGPLVQLIPDTGALAIFEEGVTRAIALTFADRPGYTVWAKPFDVGLFVEGGVLPHTADKEPDAHAATLREAYELACKATQHLHETPPAPDKIPL